jgi:hypothetical protein
METRQASDARREYGTKVFLTLIFVGLFAAFMWWITGRGSGLIDLRLSPLDLLMLALATFRLGRMIAYDLVMEPLRAPFAETVPDGTGAGDSVEPRGVGVRRAVGQLISCPICAGTWVAALLVYALYAYPGPARVFLAIMAAVGAAELLNAFVEVFCWSGQLARTVTGKQVRSQAAPPEEPEDESPQSSALGKFQKQNGGAHRRK